MTRSFCFRHRSASVIDEKGDGEEMHPNCEAVNHILQAAGLPGRVRMLNEAVTTARAAAEHLGCAVGAIANSLIFSSSGEEPLLIMTSGAHRVDMINVGERLGVELHRASRVDCFARWRSLRA